ncbi:MAG: putative DNA binding domain-containing protein [Muribaculaceae bacterium]|nr:putative DNA binding domain-containing protein [Muribaculaceae bacterium]
MTEAELLQMRDMAESGMVQFKERAHDRYDIGCEMVAFSNSHGGKLIIGINDKTGEVNALSYTELQETTNLLANVAAENVIPNILIDVENISTKGGAVVVATIPEGKNKPYHDNKGVIWIKNGADKRKVFDNAELAEMMSECGNFDPDEATVAGATIDDLDSDTIKLYLMSRFAPVFKGKQVDELNMKNYTLDQMAEFVIKGSTIERLLRNLRFIRPDGKMTVAAMLLFGKYTQRWLPVMTAKCISFLGNSVGGTQFRDKMHDMEIEGNILHQFKAIMNFFTRNLRKVQVEREFNSIGELEIPYESLIEYTVNALVHRSLNIKSPIRIFIFDNRVEIHSPGTLPNGLTVEDIKNGTSMPRNMFLFTNAIYLLPYTGAGSGVRRALEYDPNAVFSNGIGSHNEITHASNEFVITIPRGSHRTSSESKQAIDPQRLNIDSNTDPQQLNTDPNTDPQQPNTDPNTDPQQLNTDPQQPNTDPNTNPQQLNTDPNTDPQQPNTDPNTDPQQPNTDPNTNPQQANTDPNTDPQQTNTDPLPKIVLTKKQQDIRNFCSVPRGRKEILIRAGVTDHFDNRKKYIYDLVEAGILERTIPDKPNARNQKYRRKK